MGSQLYWNMNQANPFSGDAPRAPPPPILGNLDREMMSSPSLPPDSTTRGRSLSDSSEVELSRCSACPSPGLVPPSAMVSHVVTCHRGQGFQCAACRHVGVNTSLLGYEELKEHIRQAHKVTSEGLMPTAIILPTSLVQWRCKLCGGAMVFLREDLAREHILTVHGPFYLKKVNDKKSKDWCMASCRLCNHEGGGLAEHIATAHPRDDFADEDDEDMDVPNVEAVNQDPDQIDRNQLELNSSVMSVNTSVGSVSVRSDLYPGERAGPAVQRSISPADPQVKLSPRSRSSSPDIVFEKEVIANKAETERKRLIKKESLKRKKRKKSSSSSSGTSSDSSDGEKRKGKSKEVKKKRPKRWVTDIGKYITPPKVSLNERRTPSSSPSPVSRKGSNPKPNEKRNPSTSPEYQAPVSSPESPILSNKRSKTLQPHNPPLARSRSRSLPKVYASENRRHGYRSPGRPSQSVRPLSRISSSPNRHSFRPSYSVRSPRRTHSRSPTRRFSGTSPSRFSGTPPRRSRYSRSPPRRYSRSPPRRFSKSPGRPNDSPERSHSRSVSKQGHETSKLSRKPSGSVPPRRWDDKVHCSVCNIDCDNSTQFNQHKLGQRHKEAAVKAGISLEPATFSVSSRPVASFGKIYCSVCNSASEVKHFDCSICKVHSLSKVTHDQHLKGKKHQSNSKSAKPKGFMQIKSPIKFGNLGNVAAFPDQKHCPSCDEIFTDVTELNFHVREAHGIFITCKECKVLKHPAFEALTCEELVDHLTADHYKTNIVESDLKYYGEVPNWKQGYIKCNLCPPIKLGNIGLWFDNEVNTVKMRNHFKAHHSKHTFNAISYLTLGCQLCSTTLTSEKMPTWLSHLASHQTAQVPAEQVSYNPAKGEQVSYNSAKGGTTSTCPYCSTPVPQADEQEHVKSHHLHLTFSCKLCPVADRFLYKDYDDILRHLKLKHNGNNPNQNIIFPGDMKNLANFAWVKCKTCDFKGLGLGKEVMKHLAEKHRSGGLQDFNIFCRICDKDERSICNFDDAEEFIDHMQTGHGGMIKYLPAKAWLRGLDLGVGV